MKAYIYSAILSILFISSCAQEIKKVELSHQDSTESMTSLKIEKFDPINPEGQTVNTRILPPNGYIRTNVIEGTFAEFLRTLPLKPNDAVVELYNGDIKPNDNIYEAVIDLDIGKRDLHQCADAIMRLRAEYLWNKKMYDQIHFNFTNGFRVDYSEWMKGKRISVKGNSTSWYQATTPSNTYQDFWKYMEIVFSYAGTLSLSKELKPVDINELEIGDVFIQGGSPGHAVIVIDMVINPKTKKKAFLLAQSYMPAQDLQILKNPNDESLSPWYSIDFGYSLYTPEWSFYKTDLKRF